MSVIPIPMKHNNGGDSSQHTFGWSNSVISMGDTIMMAIQVNILMDENITMLVIQVSILLDESIQ